MLDEAERRHPARLVGEEQHPEENRDRVHRSGNGGAEEDDRQIAEHRAKPHGPAEEPQHQRVHDDPRDDERRAHRQELGDFLVLPGESLAKHRLGAQREGAAPEPLTPEEELELEDVFQPPSEPGPEGATSDGAWPDSEPGAPEDLALAAVADARAEEEAFEEEPPSPDAEPAVAESDAEIAEDVDLVATDAAEPADAGEPVEASPAMDSQPAEELESAPMDAAAADDLDSGAAGGDLSEEAPMAAAEEGPEPARIPTSLTAALREQGPRYPHRVSRRTRRKGRDNRDRGPLPSDAPRPFGRFAALIRVVESRFKILARLSIEKQLISRTIKVRNARQLLTV